MEKRKPTQREIKLAEKWPLWEKGPCEFDWSYDEDETCYIISGKATVVSKGKEISFQKGDWVHFEKGLACRWKIEETIRKRYRFG